MKNTKRWKGLAAGVIFTPLIGLTSLAIWASGGDLVDPPQLSIGSGPMDVTAGSGNKQVPPRRIQEITSRFETSLHATRRGKARFYSAEWRMQR
jgi:hypothetical protein